MLSGGQCVPISECGCNYNGVYYSSGESFYDDLCSQKCSCAEGGVSCAPSQCSPTEECQIEKGVRGCFSRGSATCIAAGHSRYRTFDNTSFSFRGQCSYVLAQSSSKNMKGKDLTPFTVTVTHENQGSGPGSIRSVTCEVYQRNLTLNQGEKGIIQVNGENFRLPVTLQFGKIRVEDNGQGRTISVDGSVLVRFNNQGNSISVTVPSNYMNSMSGLGGNYNGIAEDDVGKTPEEITAFGNKWKVSRETDKNCDGCGGRDNPCPSCQEEKKKIFLQLINCGIISDPSGPFANCHSKVNPKTYLDDCVSDLCETNGEDSSVLCTRVTMYADACKYAGVKDLTWRKDDFCPIICVPHSHYTTKADMCSTSCRSIYDTYECSDLYNEGCECDEDYVFDGENCIPLKECGCFDNGRYYKANEIVLSDDCSLECTCDPISGLSCQNKSCAAGDQCQIVDGVRSCVNSDPCKSKICRTKETCQLQDGVARCTPDFTGTCFAWGDPHFGSYDGYNYDFQGTCSYTLSKCTGSDTNLEPFDVVIKANNRGSQAVSYVEITHVTVYNTKLTVVTGEYPKIRVNDEIINLPATFANGKLKVTRSGLTVSIEAECGLLVTSDWNWQTTVTIPSSYYNATSGLCGNFNQDANDEQKSPNGTQITSTIDWAASWKVDSPDQFCFDHCPGKCPTCNEAKQQQYSSENQCGIILRENGPFQGCISKVDAVKFFKACLFDVCMTDGAKIILCQSLETYASACLNQGVKLLDWRTPSNCPKICEDKNSHYNACGNACPASCFDRNAPAKCTKPCVETCECNTGMVLSGGECVSISNCGCQYNGRYYNPDQSWYNEKCSIQCKCDSSLGMVVCKEIKCKDSETCLMSNGVPGCYPKKYTTCLASGKPQYTTFDKKNIDFMGTCIYQLVGVTSQDPSLTDFTVNMWNEHRGNKAVSVTKEITTKVYNMTITMSTDYPQQIKVNGRLVNLPCNLDSKIICYKSGTHVIAKTDFDLWVNFDGISYATVTLPSTYMGAVNGLCGNNNGDPRDDFNIKDGIEAKSAEEFGNHWKVGGEDGCTTICPGCPKCSEADKEPYKSDKHCGLLTKPNGPFSQCHDAIDPTPFFKDCLFDACASKGRQSVVCNTIAAYVSECQRNGSMIKEWRMPSFCELSCPVNSHYKLLGDGCPVTCFDLTSPRTCVKSYTEGCYCNDGFMWSGDECVPMAECGCVYKNMYYKSGQEFFSNDLCQEKCTCGKNGKTSCQANTCGINEECKVVDGILGCHAKEFGQCIAWGDLHYITFDKRYYDMQGTCSYILFSLRTEKVTLIVTVENEPYGNVATTKSVTVTVGNHVIRLEREKAWSIEVNKERFHLPCQSPKHQFWINEEGNNVIIHTTYGITMLYDRLHFFSISVPSSFAGLPGGLCGNFNKNPKDDFRLPNGTTVADLTVFAESWAVGQLRSECRGCSGDDCFTCDEVTTAESQSPNKCGLITDSQGPFKNCSALMSPEQFVKSCVFDVCASGAQQDALCASLQMYASWCQEKEVKIGEWRNIAGCPYKCPANSRYEVCTKTCDFTCNGVLAKTTCSDKCYEGCQCDVGFMFDGENCVTVDACGCNHYGRYLKR
ncbi:IgGFc-binding protein-like [Eleutherodactylus coqui]|uniref:IgGFc-binding protein-like n=1 Tax=Eleutherodactylus coqui TaxID=57060 RepID=UPI0034624D3A